MQEIWSTLRLICLKTCKILELLSSQVPEATTPPQMCNFGETVQRCFYSLEEPMLLTSEPLHYQC